MQVECASERLIMNYHTRSSHKRVTFSHDYKNHKSHAHGQRPMLQINPLNVELNPICHLLALLGAHHILHISRVRVKLEPLIQDCSCGHLAQYQNYDKSA